MLFPFFRIFRIFPLGCTTSLVLVLTTVANAQELPKAAAAMPAVGSGTGAQAFAQLETLLPNPNEVRLASGAPGPQYWQQKVDYSISVRLDERTHRLEGDSHIHYINHSPHTLTYIWLQLDQNRFKQNSDANLALPAPNFVEIPYEDLAQRLALDAHKGGFELGTITNEKGATLRTTLVGTMMRVDLDTPLLPMSETDIKVPFSFNIVDGTKVKARTGYELFERDKNALYEIAQFYPRTVTYMDYTGWQHKQYLGVGEFTLEFGDYEIAIDVPADHIVAATGELQNAQEVLSKAQQDRLAQARKKSDKPIFIVTPDEAKSTEQIKSSARKIWRFTAKNVRDVAFASSRKFIWDAMSVTTGKTQTLAMSFYPNEADPLWSQYSTQAVAHALEVYSKYTFDYPYPVAISVNGPVGGMEYPMICFNAPRPYDDKTYWNMTKDKRDRVWQRSKYGLISVIIHEVGHNYFPMIVSSDERQWTWMDEGLNTYLQFLAEQSFEKNYPSVRGEPKEIAMYMANAEQVPIMTNSESVLQLGNNAYAKPATALNILRESIMGRALFDFAFREYSQRWEFKHPTPADFFRSMEDASGIDLDWFWRGWFYGTGRVDVAITGMAEHTMDTRDPEIEKKRAKDFKASRPKTLSAQAYEDEPKRLDSHPEIKDFYNRWDEFAVTAGDRADYQKFLDTLEAQDRVLLANKKRFYTVNFENLGGVVTPLPLRLTYADGSQKELTLPAEIWRYNATQVSKLFIEDKALASVEFDPYLSTADTNEANNTFPEKIQKSRFQLFKIDSKANPMQRERDKK
jgi:Peptidase family M1 domain